MDLKATEIMGESISYNPLNAELHYRQSAYLFLSGKIEDSMIKLENAVQLDYNLHHLLFEIAPMMQNDDRINWIINTNKKI
jgi:hypothetical protein